MSDVGKMLAMQGGFFQWSRCSWGRFLGREPSRDYGKAVSFGPPGGGGGGGGGLPVCSGRKELSDRIRGCTVLTHKPGRIRVFTPKFTIFSVLYILLYLNNVIHIGVKVIDLINAVNFLI